MSEFLKLNSPDDFWDKLRSNIDIIPREKEIVQFTESLTRILAVDITSPENLPPFNRSTVDGFAVRAGDTAGASASLPVYLDVIGEVLMGESTDLQVKSGQAVKIPTGGILPAGADSVIMVEYTEYLAENTVESTCSVAEGENVVKKGEDIGEGELLLEKGHQIRPQDIGALAGLGITEIEVYSRPRVTVISTGDELVPPGANAGPGEIRDINTFAIGSMLEEAGCEVNKAGIVEDSFNRLKEAVKANLNSDLILISGGSSVGVKDMTIDVLNSLGKPGVLLHGLSIKPGKPTILAVIDGKPVLGLPGHPASAWTVASRLVKPIVRFLKGEITDSSVTGKDGISPELFTDNFREIEAVLARNLVSDKGREEYIPVKLITVGETDNDLKYRAEPITGKSSLITTLVEADGFIRIATYREGKNRGDRVRVNIF